MTARFQVGQVLHRAHVQMIFDRRPRVEWTEWRVESLTRCGAWIRLASGSDRSRKWISDRTRFVQPTEAAALESLKARTRARLIHARRRLEEAGAAARVLGLEAE